MSKRYTCPCCGYLTLSEFPGSFEICEICFWEDDNVQLRNPSFAGGANRPSLIEAQSSFEQFGACSEGEQDYCREVTEADSRDPKWRKATQDDVPTPDHKPGDAYAHDQIERYYYWLR